MSTDLLLATRSYSESRSMPVSTGSFSAIALSYESFALPLADPGAPPIISEGNQPSRGHEFVDLRPDGRCFRFGSEIIVDHKPATVGQQIAIAIQVPAHVAIGIENEETHLTARPSIWRMADIVVSWNE